MNKIFYGDIQPNHKEHKIWINSKGIIKTYNRNKQQWGTLIQSTDEPAVPEEPEIIFEFTINNIIYQAVDGMTWQQWVNSKYNVDGFTINEDNIHTGNKFEYPFVSIQSSLVHATDVIQNIVYTTNWKSSVDIEGDEEGD